MIENKVKDMKWHYNQRRKHYILDRIVFLSFIFVVIGGLGFYWVGMTSVNFYVYLAVVYSLIGGLYTIIILYNTKDTPKKVKITEEGIHLKLWTRYEVIDWEKVKSITPSTPLIILLENGKRKKIYFLDNRIKNKIYSTFKSKKLT